MTMLANTTQSPFVRALHRSGLLAGDIDYHIVRASMVIMFLFFGYQKWFPYEFERLVPFISNGPLIWWLYPVFGHAGASYFLGVSEWTFGALLLAGFWDKRDGEQNDVLRQEGHVARHRREASCGDVPAFRHERNDGDGRDEGAGRAEGAKNAEPLVPEAREQQRPEGPLRDAEEVAGAGVAEHGIQPPDQRPVADERD